MNFQQELRKLWIEHIAKNNNLLKGIERKTKFTRDYLRDLNCNYPTDTTFNLVPRQIRKFLADHGWKELAASSRVVYRKDDEILKLAVDGFGFVQNLQETRVSRMRNWKLKKPNNLEIPKIYFIDKSYAFIISQYISGEAMLPPEHIIDFIYKELDCGDIHENNWKKQGRKWYLIDTGCAYRATGI